MEQVTKFKTEDYLKTREDMQIYLVVSLEEYGVQGFISALGDVAKAKGMTDISKDTKLSRQNLYKALSKDASPKFETINKVVESLGFKLQIS